MTPNPYLYEKLIVTHQAQIRHEMQQIRLSARARQQRTLVHSTIGSLGTLLIELGSQLQRAGQRSKAPLHSA